MSQDILDKIALYEEGQMSEEDALDLFTELVETGLAWSLQGSYGRTAEILIRSDRISCTKQQAGLECTSQP